MVSGNSAYGTVPIHLRNLGLLIPVQGDSGNHGKHRTNFQIPVFTGGDTVAGENPLELHGLNADYRIDMVVCLNIERIKVRIAQETPCGSQSALIPE